MRLICESHSRVRPQDTFTLWFNAASDVAPAGKPMAHMKKVEKEVEDQVAASGGKVRAKFLDKSFFDLTI